VLKSCKVFVKPQIVLPLPEAKVTEMTNDAPEQQICPPTLEDVREAAALCDAIMTDTPGALTFPINQKLLAGVLTVSDDDVRCAMAFAFEHFKIVVEPGAAVGLAAVLSQRIDIKDKTICVIATGGNVDAADFCAALNARAE
jgi:threonine dehydratase